MPADRIILVGGPRTGKSTAARALREQGVPTFCTDPLPLVKQPEPGATYLPDVFATPGMWSEATDFIVAEWLPMPGPWCLEGVATARALRKALRTALPGELPCERIIVYREPWGRLLPGQERMGKAVLTVWSQVAGRLRPITVKADQRPRRRSIQTPSETGFQGYP